MRQINRYSRKLFFKHSTAQHFSYCNVLSNTNRFTVYQATYSNLALNFSFSKRPEEKRLWWKYYGKKALKHERRQNAMAEDAARKAGSNWHKKAEQNKGKPKKKAPKKGSKKGAPKGGKGPPKKNKVAPEGGANATNNGSKTVKPGAKKGAKKDVKKVKKKKPGP